MGLLSDPEYGSVKWVKVLKKVHAPVCLMCYVGAIVWFLLLAHREFNNETYFSENALLPGLVTNEFNGEHAAKQFYNEFLQELDDKYADSDEIPVPWLVGKLSQLHLDVYTHNFSLDYPLGNGQKYHGTNVYGILRAARTPSLEAVVVSAPYRSLGSHQKGTHAGIALMLAFAQFARPQKYWAKDIIFLITEHEQLGMQAWLEAYHGLQSHTETFYSSLGSFWAPSTPGVDLSSLAPGFTWTGDHKKCLNPGKLKGRSGSIQAAINLEFHTPKIKYIEVKVEGLNGQLPNLDLVNLVHKLCVKSGIHHSYKNSHSWLRTRNKMEEWKNGVWTVMGMVSAQIAGVPNGNHGLFHRFNIEAVTLEGRDSSDNAPPPRVNTLSPANFHRLGVLLESVLRSLNNLLERFHQSYFFYLLPATNRFVSIGQYMPSLCLLCVAMLVRALYLWVTIQENDQTDKHADKPAKLDKKIDGLEETEGTEKEKLLQSEVPGDKRRERVKLHEQSDKLDTKTDELEETEKERLQSEVPGDKKRERVKLHEQSDKLDTKTDELEETEKERLQSEVPGDKRRERVKLHEQSDKLDTKTDELEETEKERLQSEVPGDKRRERVKLHEQSDKLDTKTDELEETEKERLQSEVPGDKRRERVKLHEQSDKLDTKTDELEETEKERLQSTVPGDKKRERVNRQESSMSVVNIGTNYLFVHLLGYAVMNSPMIFSKIGAKYFDLPSEVSVFYGLIMSSVLLTLLTPYLPRLHPARMTREEVTLVNILVLVELATVCLSIGMHNFSLGLTVAVVYTPLALLAGVVSKESSSLLLVVKRVFCLALHPLCVVSLAMITYGRFIFPEDSLFDTISRGGDAAMQAIMFSIVDSMIYGNWLFNVSTTTLLPIWIIFWQILCNKVDG